MDIMIGWVFFILGWCGNNLVRLFLLAGLLYYGLKYALELQPVQAAGHHANYYQVLYLGLLLLLLSLLVIPFAIQIAN